MFLSVAAIQAFQTRQVKVGGYHPGTVDQRLEKRGVGLTTKDLIGALANSDAEVRVLAANKLANDNDREAVPFILAALSTETIDTNRMSMALYLAQLGDHKGVDLLKGACSDQKTGGP